MKLSMTLLSAMLLWGHSVFADATKVQTVIQSQLEAIQSDNFSEAFEFAAPNIRMIFQSADRFGQMVRGGYPMVYRNRSVTYGKYSEDSQFSSQIVNLESLDGSVFQLRYDLVETPEGWKIQGVQILGRSSVGA